jgi:ABC-type cobalamin transport system permease subunit
MLLDTVRFLALLFVALTLAPSAAHALELLNKIDLSHDDYLTVQQIYRGWALLGSVILGALLSTLALAILSRRARRLFALALAAFGCIAAAQLVFWAFTYPANAATRNWTVLGPGWEALRAQWEYSHAVGALFNLAAMVLLIVYMIAATHAPRRVE